MKNILNFTEDRCIGGYYPSVNAFVVPVTADVDVNKLILKKIKLSELTKQIKKGKSVKDATATMIWRAVRATIKKQRVDDIGGILIPKNTPDFVTSKLERKLRKRGMCTYKVSDLSYS